MGNIQGITYNKKQSEFQFFPEEYFSGSDVSIYLGDMYIDEIMSLAFQMEERVTPVFGYNSYSYDAVARGQRIIQGSFSIPFKEAGYLHRVLDHIGQLKHEAKPQLAYELGGVARRPTWLGGVDETIEELLDRQAKVSPDKQVLVKAPKWPTMALGNRNDSVKALQQYLLKNPVYIVNSDSLTKNMRRVPGTGFTNSGPEVQKLKARLNEYVVTGLSSGLDQALSTLTPTFDAKTEQAVKLFQSEFSKSLSVDGIVGPLTRAALNKALSVSGTYDAPTKLAVMRLQRRNGLVPDGIFGANSRGTMEVSVEVPDVSEHATAEAQYANYEADIWAGTSKYSVSRKDAPFFYGNEKQAWLLHEGFDLFVNYGQTGQVSLQGGSLNEKLSHNTTVKAIRGVQINNVSQTIGPTGEAIAEVYSFIARDMD